jgi:hypothetical protein
MFKTQKRIPSFLEEEKVIDRSIPAGKLKKDNYESAFNNLILTLQNKKLIQDKVSKDVKLGKKINHWRWWIFPTNMVGVSDPYKTGIRSPEDYLTLFENETVGDILLTIYSSLVEMVISRGILLSDFLGSVDSDILGYWVNFIKTLNLKDKRLAPMLKIRNILIVDDKINRHGLYQASDTLRGIVISYYDKNKLPSSLRTKVDNRRRDESSSDVEDSSSSSNVEDSSSSSSEMHIKKKGKSSSSSSSTSEVILKKEVSTSSTSSTSEVRIKKKEEDSTSSTS